MLVTLTNTFHGTKTRVRVPSSLVILGPDGAIDHRATQREVADYLARFAEARWRRVSRAMCGISGCCCGGVRP